jgi:hypothetical protein
LDHHSHLTYYVDPVVRRVSAPVPSHDRPATGRPPGAWWASTTLRGSRGRSHPTRGENGSPKGGDPTAALFCLRATSHTRLEAHDHCFTLRALSLVEMAEPGPSSLLQERFTLWLKVERPSIPTNQITRNQEFGLLTFHTMVKVQRPS